MTPLEVFATGLVVISAAVLGLSLVLTTVRGAALARRHSALRQVVQARNDEIEAIERRAASVDQLLRDKEAACGDLETRRVRVDAAARAAAADKVELVHELGTPQAGHTQFRCDLRTVPDFGRVEARRIVFSRAIWDRRNVALVWAPGSEAAMTAVQRAFPEASGIVAGRLQPETAAPAVAPGSGPGSGPRSGSGR